MNTTDTAKALARRRAIAVFWNPLLSAAVILGLTFWLAQQPQRAASLSPAVEHSQDASATTVAGGQDSGT